MADPTNFKTVATYQNDAGNFRVSAIQGQGAVAGNSYTNIALSAQTVVKSAAGFLHGIQFNTNNISAVRLYDNTVSGGTTIATLPTSGMAALGFFQYDLAFATGLVVSTGSSNTDITVMYQ